MRYARMTPSGSFNRSNREIWVRIGRSGSTPYRSTTARTLSSGRSRFLSLSGSIEGGTMYCGIASCWAKSGIEKIEASYWAT